MLHNRDRDLQQILLAVVIGCVALSATIRAQQPVPAFKALDADGDGQLTRDELPARLRGNFDRVDTDGDGAISAAEDRAFRNRSRPAAPRVPETIELISDVAYAGTDNPRQTLHLLLPRQRDRQRSLPVIVFIHGGGWRNGDKSSGLRTLIPLIESGEYAGVSIGYRLTDEAQWPEQMFDCKAAIRWIRGHAREHGLDPERIGAIGTSAGGHLVSMLGVSGNVAVLEGDLGEDDEQSSRVTCVVNMFGPSELLTMDDHPGTMTHNAADSPESLLIGGPIQEHPQRTRAASPVTYVSEDDPPFLHIHGTDDPLVPFAQSQRLHSLLSTAAVASTLVPVQEGQHGGFNNPEVDQRVRGFFDRHLRGTDSEVTDTPIEQGPRRR